MKIKISLNKLLYTQLFLSVLLVVINILCSVYYENKTILLSIFTSPITIYNILIYIYFIYAFIKYRLFELWYYLLLIFPIFYILIAIPQIILSYFDNSGIYRIGLIIAFISSIMLICYNGMSFNKNNKYFSFNIDEKNQ